ncbi:hypothetical protein ACFE04_020030 [Oxalis oulophora]
MGNIGSSGATNRRRQRRSHNNNHHNSPSQTPTWEPTPAVPQASQQQSTEVSANRYVFAAATPYPNPNPPPSPPYYNNNNFPAGVAPAFVEHQKAVTIRNDVNLKKDSLKIVADVDNPGTFLVCFTFDATVATRITLTFFAKEGEECNLTPTKENLLIPVTLKFEKGLGQNFKQPSGTGIDFAMFEEAELQKQGDIDIYPLVVKAEALVVVNNENGSDENPTNSQITQAIFEKEKGEYHVRVGKQILWVNKMRYELQEIYGIGNSVDGDVDGNDPGKECVICLSEPRDTTVLPCRHMCMCSGCAKVLRFQTDRCPICRQLVERLLEIKVNRGDQPEE